MKDPKNHLDIDLEFLDKKEQAKVAPKPSESTGHTSHTANPVTTGYKYNWKNILIIGGIILFFGWAIFSNSDSSSTSNSTYTPPAGTNSNNLLSEGGQTFRCSDSNYDRAMQLKPSATLGAQLGTESDNLDRRIAANKAEKTALDGMYVDESDQYAIDSYNSRVDAYNAERARLIPAVQSWTQRHDAFDAQIDTYNNFLDANCSPQ